VAGETLSRGALELELDHLSQGKHHLQAPARLPRPPHPPAAAAILALHTRGNAGFGAQQSSV
jgi:hypothetical protein